MQLILDRTETTKTTNLHTGYGTNFTNKLYIVFLKNTLFSWKTIPKCAPLLRIWMKVFLSLPLGNVGLFNLSRTIHYVSCQKNKHECVLLCYHCIVIVPRYMFPTCVVTGNWHASLTHVTVMDTQPPRVIYR